MAYRRTTRRRVSKRKPRRGLRKRMTTSRLTQGKIYSYKRTCQLTPYVYSSGAGWAAGGSGNVITNDTAQNLYEGIFKFRLADLPGYTDFTNLYEQFKITGVKLRFVPFYGTESSSLTTSYMEPMAYCIDRGANDQTTSSFGFNSLLENQDVKIRTSQRGVFSVWIGKPCAHQPADSNNQVAYARPWLDTELGGSSFVDHHGLKFSWQTLRPSENSVRYKVYATYYIKCRNPQ